MASSNPLKNWMTQYGESEEEYDSRKQAAFDAVRNQYIPKIEERNKREAEQRERNTYIPAQFGQRMLESQNRRRYENTYVPASLAENALHGETDGEDYLSYSNARLRGEYLARSDTASLQAELDALERSIEEERKQYNRAKMRLASYGNNTGTNAARAEQRYIDAYEQKQAQAETLRQDISEAGALQAEIARQSQQIANEKRYRNTYVPASLAQDAIHRSGNGADFNAYADARLRGEYISHVDTAKLQSELDALERSIEQERKQYNRAKLRLASYGNNVGTTAARADQRYIDAYEQKQARAQALRRDISDAESIQKAAEYNSLRGRSDFAEKSKPAGTKIATFNLLDPSTWAAGDDKYDFINNIGGYKNIVRGLAEADGEPMEYGTYSGLARMTQDEIATYNYIYATEGKEAADEYLDFLEDELNYRQGQAEAALVEGSLLRSVGYSMGAGIRRFGDNIGDMFAGEVSAIRPYEYGTQIARENLADTGAQLPEWMGGASVGQVLFDAAGTAGNMLPSILLSTLTGGAGASTALASAAGSASMGLSASGGARMQALRDGYTPEQATQYGILIGASEGALQYLLGGISKLGGKLTGGVAAKAIQNIDNALLRVAANGAIHMAGEGAEEYLQEILDPIYRNLLLDENNEIDLADPEAVYSFMLGALTAGVMDAPQIIRDGRTRAPSLQSGAPAADAAPQNVQEASSGTIPGRNNIDLVPIEEALPGTTPGGIFHQEQGLITNTIPETGEKSNHADALNLKNASSEGRNVEIAEHLRNLKQDVTTMELNPERIRTDADMEAIARKDITQYTADDIYTIVSALESKKGLHLKDLSRVLDAVSGENRNLHQALHNLIEADYNRALGEHGRMQSSDLESLRDRYKQRGIEGGSKESAAVMKFGQGYYIDRDGTRIDYTLDDLKKEFPDRWQDIAKTAEEDRALYDSYIDRINAMREQIYPEAMKQAQAELENTKAALASYDQKAARLNETIQGVQSKIDAYREKLAAKKRTDTAAYEKLKNGISYQERRMNRAMQELEKTMQRAADARFKTSRLEDEIKNGEPLHQRKIERKQDYYHHVYASNLGIDLMTLIGAKNAASDMVAGRYTGEAGGAVGNFIDRMLGSIFGSKEISPGMVGVSDNTSPRVKWQGIMEHQKGGPYKLDAYESMADYIGMADYMLAFDAYTSRLRDITNLLQSAADRLDKTVGKSARNANSFIEWMKDWNDMLTGKTLPLDRGIQKVVGRNVMNGIRKLNSAAKSSTLLGNFRSMFVQGSAMANAMNYIPNPLDWINGARYMANAMSGKDGYVDAINQSDFLAQRNMLTPNDIVKGGFLREAQKPLGKMLNVFQNAVDRLTWWTAYAQYDAASQTEGGLDKLNRRFTRAYDDAIDYADDITRRSVAGRGVGEQPMTVKSTTVDTFAPFQTEVLNTYNSIKENIHALISKDATKEQKARAAAGLLAYEVSAFAINLIMNAIFGEDVVGFDFIGALTGALANDDDEDEDATANRIYEGIAGATLSGIPFASFATPLIMDQETAQALFGEDADPSRYGTGTMGTNAAADIVKTFFFDKNADGWDKLNAVSAFFPLGGKQIARTAQGIATVAQGGSYTQDAEGNERLQYRTDQGPLDYLRAGIFGKWSLPEARAYVEAGFPTLSAAHTAAYKNAVASGVDGAHFLVLLDRYKALEPIKNEAGKTEQSTKQQFREMLFRDSSLTNEQKTQMDRDLLCTEGQSPADYSSKSRFELSNNSPSAYERFEENIAGGMSEEEAFRLEDWANRFAGIQSYTDERGNYVGPQEQKRRMLFADETLTADEKEQIDRALIMGDGENARPADYSAKAMFDLFMQSEIGYDNVIGATGKGIPEALALKVETWRQNQIARDNFSKDGYVDYMRGLGMSTSQINIILAETNKSWKPIE